MEKVINYCADWSRDYEPGDDYCRAELKKKRNLNINNMEFFIINLYLSKLHRISDFKYLQLIENSC